MSDIRVDTISAANGTDPVTLTKQSAAKGWIYGSSTATINGSFNCSGGIDNGTGDYTYNLTSAMNSTDDLAVVQSPRTSGDSVGPAGTVGSSAVVVHVYDISAHAAVDRGVNIIIHGELA